MYKFHVERMTCGGCATRVTKAVLAVDDEAQVNVDLKSKSVSVESDLDINAFAAAITRPG